MAKHQKGKFLSKGQRRSSLNAGKPVFQPAITFNAVQPFLNAMQEAFINTQEPVLMRKALKVAKNLGKGISFTGRYRTRQALINAGALS